MSSQAETFCRNRRLYDVRRGVVYLRRTDDLAQNQWRHFGTVPAIKTHVIRDVGVTTRLSDVTVMGSQGDASEDRNIADSGGSLSDVRADVKANEAASTSGGNSSQQQREQFLYKTRVLEERTSVRPQISVTEVTDKEGGVSVEHPPTNEHAPLDVRSLNDVSMATSASVATPHAGTASMTWSEAGVGLQDLSRETHPSSLLPQEQQHSVSKDLQHSRREAPCTYGLHHPHPEGGAASAFDTWGSRNWAVEDKLEPDPLPKSHAPKHYPPMSRAMGAGLGQKGARSRRQLKTLTDFRSRNGTLRIIRPPAPVPAIKSRLQPHHHDADVDDSDEEFDVSTLGREKTYAMLKRIDRLLKPAKAFFVSDLSSSVREVRSSSPSSLSDLRDSLPGNDIDDRHLPPPGGKTRQAEGHVHVHSEDDFLKHFRRGPGDQLHPLDECDQARGELVQPGADRVSSIPSGRLGESWQGAEGLSRSHDGGFRQSTNVEGREIIREQHNPRLDAQVRRFLYGQPDSPGKTGRESSRHRSNDSGEPIRASQTEGVGRFHHYRQADDSLPASRVQRPGREIPRPGHLPLLQREVVGGVGELRPRQFQRGGQDPPQREQISSDYTYPQRNHVSHQGPPAQRISSDYTYPQRNHVSHQGPPAQRISSDYTCPQRHHVSHQGSPAQRVSSDYTYPQRQPKHQDQARFQRQVRGPFCSEHEQQHGGDRQGRKGKGAGKVKAMRGVEAGWLSGLAEGLESGVDMFAKCEDWVSKSFADHSPRPTA